MATLYPQLNALPEVMQVSGNGAVNHGDPLDTVPVTKKSIYPTSDLNLSTRPAPAVIYNITDAVHSIREVAFKAYSV